MGDSSDRFAARGLRDGFVYPCFDITMPECIHPVPQRYLDVRESVVVDKSGVSAGPQTQFSFEDEEHILLGLSIENISRNLRLQLDRAIKMTFMDGPAKASD